jgi:hypothetical protein
LKIFFCLPNALAYSDNHRSANKPLSRTQPAQQNLTKYRAMTINNLVTPKTPAKKELLINKPVRTNFQFLSTLEQKFKKENKPFALRLFYTTANITLNKGISKNKKIF